MKGIMNADAMFNLLITNIRCCRLLRHSDWNISSMFANSTSIYSSTTLQRSTRCHGSISADKTNIKFSKCTTHLPFQNSLPWYLH